MNRGVKNIEAADRICKLILLFRSREDYLFLGRMMYEMGYLKAMRNMNGDVSVDLKKVSSEDLTTIKNNIIKYIDEENK